MSRKTKRQRMSGASSRRTPIVLSVIILAAAGALIAMFAAGNSQSSSSSSAAQVKGAQDVASLISAIPQQGTAIGNTTAPVTMIAYEDLKCPVCQRLSQNVLPDLISKYVKAGKVRVVYEPQTFVGQSSAPGDSERAARFALAAGQQNKFWNFVELFYDNQQDETTTYVTNDLLKSLGSKISGLDVNKALSDMDSDQITQELVTAKTRFAANNFNGTPSFMVGKTAGTMTTLTWKNLTVDEFSGPIDNLLKP